MPLTEEKYRKLEGARELLAMASPEVRSQVERAMADFRAMNPQVTATFGASGIESLPSKLEDKAPAEPATQETEVTTDLTAGAQKSPMFPTAPSTTIVTDAAPVPGEPLWMTQQRQKVAAAEAEAQGAEAPRTKEDSLSRLDDPRYYRPPEYTGKDHQSYSWRSMLPSFLGGVGETYYDPSDRSVLESLPDAERQRILSSQHPMFELDKIRDERWVQAYDKATQTGQPLRRYSERLMRPGEKNLGQMSDWLAQQVTAFAEGVNKAGVGDLVKGAAEGYAEALGKGAPALQPHLKKATGEAQARSERRKDAYESAPVPGAAGYIVGAFSPMAPGNIVGQATAKAAEPLVELAAKGGNATRIGARLARGGAAGAAGSAAQSAAEDAAAGDFEDMDRRAVRNAIGGALGGVFGEAAGGALGRMASNRRDPMRNPDADLFRSADKLGIEPRLRGDVKAPKDIKQLRGEVSGTRDALAVLRDRYTPDQVRQLEKARAAGQNPVDVAIEPHMPKLKQAALKRSDDVMQSPAVTNPAKYNQSEVGQNAEVELQNFGSAIVDRLNRAMPGGRTLPQHEPVRKALSKLWHETHEVIQVPKGQKVPPREFRADIEGAARRDKAASEAQTLIRPPRQRDEVAEALARTQSSDTAKTLLRPQLGPLEMPPKRGGTSKDQLKTLPPGADELQLERRMDIRQSAAKPEKVTPKMADALDIDIPAGYDVYVRPRTVNAQELDDITNRIRLLLPEAKDSVSKDANEKLYSELEAAMLKDRDYLPSHPEYAPGNDEMVIDVNGKPQGIRGVSAAHRRSKQAMSSLEDELSSVGLPKRMKSAAREPGEARMPELTGDEDKAFQQAVAKAWDGSQGRQLSDQTIGKLADMAGIRKQLEQDLKMARAANPQATTEELVYELAQLTTGSDADARRLVEGVKVSDKMVRKVRGGDSGSVAAGSNPGVWARVGFGALAARSDPLQRSLSREGSNIIDFVKTLRKPGGSATAVLEVAPLRGGAAGYRHGAAASEITEEDRRNIKALIRAIDKEKPQ